jgi:hypothetical protein
LPERCGGLVDRATTPGLAGCVIAQAADVPRFTPPLDQPSEQRHEQQFEFPPLLVEGGEELRQHASAFVPDAARDTPAAGRHAECIAGHPGG